MPHGSEEEGVCRNLLTSLAINVNPINKLGLLREARHVRDDKMQEYLNPVTREAAPCQKGGG